MQVSIDTLFDSTGTPISQTSSSTTSEKANDELDKTDFLELLCTQLKYQDPLNPQTDTDMAAQLAQYTSLDYMRDVKTAIEEQTEAFSEIATTLQYSALSTTNSSSVALIGKTVRIEQDTIEFNGTSEEEFTVHLGSNYSAVVNLLDENGDIVRSFSATDKDSNNAVKLSWDGLKTDGTIADSGTYTIEIDGQDSDEQLYCFVNGTVDGIKYSSSGPLAVIGGQELSVSKILRVST